MSSALLASEPVREGALKGIINHLQKFWTPRMRRQIVEHFQQGGEGLDNLQREAVQRLA